MASAWLDWELAVLGDRHQDLTWATSLAYSHMAEDGKTLLVVEDAVSTYRLLSLSDGTVRPIPNFQPDWSSTWRTDGSLLVWVNLEGKRTDLYEHDLATGKQTLIRTFSPLDDTGDATSGLTWISRDLTHYMKWETQRQAFVYVVDGLR